MDSEISEQSFNNFNSAPLKKESKKNIDFNSTLNRFEIYNHKRNENIQKLRLKQESAQLIDYESMPKSTIIKGKRL